MPTNHQHRILLIVPADKVVAVVTWFLSNIGPDSVPANIGPGLSVTGLDPATHRWMCGAYTDSECKQILLRICQLASVPAPTNAQWNGWTRQQKINWLRSVQAALLAGYGVWVTLAGNDSTWDDIAVQLATMGLQVIQNG